MRYQFLIDTYETERLKVLGVWAMFYEDDMDVRPHPSDKRGRSVREQMVHQCVDRIRQEPEPQVVNLLAEPSSNILILSLIARNTLWT